MSMFHLGWFVGRGLSPQSWPPGPFAGAGQQSWWDPQLYIDLAASLERAGFDYMMIEDGMFVPDVYGGSSEYYLTRGWLVPKMDPVTYLPLIARETAHLGVIATMTTSFYPPYLAARLGNSLDHITGGRVGFNLVTSHNDRTAQNFGQQKQLEHDRRYAMADEWVRAVSALWDSWDADAVVADDEAGTYTDPAKVRPADFAGEFFRTRGPLNTMPGPQRRPVICQAGGSPAGQAFGAAHADTIIAQAADAESMRRYRGDITSLALAAGRDPKSVKILFSVSPVVDTDAGAAAERARAAAAARRADTDRALASMSYVSGIDFSRYDLDEPLPEIRTNAARASTAAFAQDGSPLTLRQITQRDPAEPPLVGTPDGIAAEMGEIMDYVGGDGFLINGPVERRYIAEITDGLGRALRRRGLIRDGYGHGTFRENLLAF
jgi:FMN-dependent oxidoreductase (nitrilotriacetate monooxygenase family)